jgi:hypothetical protein
MNKPEKTGNKSGKTATCSRVVAKQKNEKFKSVIFRTRYVKTYSRA